MIENRNYQRSIENVAELPLPWEKLEEKNFLITGARGLIGSFLIDVLMYQNRMKHLNCHIYAMGRSKERGKQRFPEYWQDANFSFLAQDINLPLIGFEAQTVHYIFHMASNTHPVAYATEPVATITSNIIGTKNLLDFAIEHGTQRFAFASSNEIYGENRGDTELFDEQYCGYIDCNTLRAGYPESKRCGEALCQAYRRQYGMDIVIPRFTRTYGPTMLKSDTKAISQFICKGLAGENIVLKSEGTQYYSYTYVADAVSGALVVLLSGTDGEAYNIADERSDIMLKDLAGIIAEIVGTGVMFEFPDEVEKAGFSKATKARLDAAKLRRLGWQAKYDIREGLQETLKIMSSGSFEINHDLSTKSYIKN